MDGTRARPGVRPTNGTDLMTTGPNQQQPAPAGWYPDPAPHNPGGQRWWDGTRWTEHFLPAPSAGPSGGTAGPSQPPYGGQAPGVPATPATYPPVAPGTSSLTAHIWLVVGLPLLTAIAFLFIDLGAYFRAILALSDPVSGPDQADVTRFASSVSTFVISVLVVDALSLVVYGLCVLFAYLDQRELVARGFARPFHWAWSFFGPVVYVIGRSVVTRRRGGTNALWPIWGVIATVVLTFAVVIVKIVVTVADIATAVGPYGSGGA